MSKKKKYPSKEDLAEAAGQTGIDCLATRFLMAVGIEVLERLGDLGDDLEGDYSAGRYLIGTDMNIAGLEEPFVFSDDSLARLRAEARQIVDRMVSRS
jgi:hypothetical protein